MTRDEMDDLTRDLPTKSAKIRILEEHGVPRAEIARYLQIRYQHVRNVLVGPKPKKSAIKDRGGVSKNANPLSIDQAKRGLAEQFGVPIDAIEITIRG